MTSGNHPVYNQLQLFCYNWQQTKITRGLFSLGLWFCGNETWNSRKTVKWDTENCWVLFLFYFLKKFFFFFLGWGFGFWVFLQRKFSSMISSGINLVMTVIGFAVSTTFIVFVCTRLVCARIHLNATRRSFPIASRSNLSIVSLFFMLFGSPFLSLFIR